MKRGVAFLAAAVCAQAACAAGQQEARGAGPRQERQAMVALVPKGYQIQIQLDDTLDSRTTRVGERVHARLLAPIDAGGRTIVPAGTRLLGTVTEVKSPTAGLLKAGIKFKIEQFGEGSNAYFRLYVDGGQAGNYADKKSALTGIDNYLAERTAKNRKQVFRK